MCHKKRPKLENYNDCLEATQHEDKVNHLEKEDEISADCLKKYHKNFIISNKSISKTQQKVENERHSVFTEKNE